MGFRDPSIRQWNSLIEDQYLKEIWLLAVNLSNKYNGNEGRYNNEDVTTDGFDFFDLTEVCWILKIGNIKEVNLFLNCIRNNKKMQ